MHRFIAFAWDASIAEKAILAKSLSRRLELQLPNWTRVLDGSGLLVYHVSAGNGASRVYKLKHGAGVVLGRLFSRDANSTHSPVAFSASETERLQQSGGRHLVEQYWGRYVAFVTERQGPRLWVLRDPTGAVPCFMAKCQDIHVICSHVDDCAALGLIKAAIDWNHVAAYLWFDRLVTTDTGLKGVQQVLAGECIEIGPRDKKAMFYWRPDRIHAQRALENRQEAMTELRDVIRNCIGAWASCYGSILHELSGGLDSAIVLACLARLPGRLDIVCENHFTRNAEGDERVFARQAAALARVHLIETPINQSNRLIEKMFESPGVTTPTQTAFVPESQPDRDRIVKARGIEAVFSGQGGDHLFQSIRTPEIAAEYAWHHGPQRELFNVISDTSRFTRKPFWSILWSVVYSGLLRHPKDPYAVVHPSPLAGDKTRGAMNPAAIRHPWIDAAADLPGSKRRQIFDIIDTQHFYSRSGHGVDVVHPLISQPIIELCLQIPSYVLTFGGVDRALVRQAFEGMVPADILARTTKGATTGYFNSLLTANLAVIRDYLLDGILIKSGVLDRRKTETALSESCLIRDSRILLPVLDALKLEFWLQTWQCTERHVAA